MPVRRFVLALTLVLAAIGFAVFADVGPAFAGTFKYDASHDTVSCSSFWGTAKVTPGLSSVNNLPDAISIKGTVSDCADTPSGSTAVSFKMLANVNKTTTVSLASGNFNTNIPPVQPGMTVVGKDIPPGDTVQSVAVNGLSLTLLTAGTGTVTGDALLFTGTVQNNTLPGQVVVSFGSVIGSLASTNSVGTLAGCSSATGTIMVKWKALYEPQFPTPTPAYKLTSGITTLTPNAIFGGANLETFPFGSVASAGQGSFEIGHGNGCTPGTATGAFNGSDSGATSNAWAETSQDLNTIIGYAEANGGVGLPTTTLTIGLGSLTVA
jgi:hypothetical protein